MTPARQTGRRLRTATGVSVAILLLAAAGATRAQSGTTSSSGADESLAEAAALNREAADAGHLARIGLARRTRRALERAGALAPDDPAVLAELARFHLSAPWLLGGRLVRAESIGTRLQIAPGQPAGAMHGSLIRGWVAHHRGDLRAAEELFAGAARLAPDAAEAQFALGHLYVDQQRADDAVRALARGLTLRPDDRAAHMELGTIAAESGTHLELAAASLQRVLAMPGTGGGPARHVVHWRLGMVFEKQGRADLARAEYEAARAERPRRREYQDALERVR